MPPDPPPSSVAMGPSNNRSVSPSSRQRLYESRPLPPPAPGSTSPPGVLTGSSADPAASLGAAVAPAITGSTCPPVALPGSTADLAALPGAAVTSAMIGSPSARGALPGSSADHAVSQGAAVASATIGDATQVPARQLTDVDMGIYDARINAAEDFGHAWPLANGQRLPGSFCPPRL